MRTQWHKGLSMIPYVTSVSPKLQRDTNSAPVTDDVLVNHHTTLLEDGNAGGAAKGKVAQLIPLLIGLPNLCCELNAAHLRIGQYTHFNIPC